MPISRPFTLRGVLLPGALLLLVVISLAACDPTSTPSASPSPSPSSAPCGAEEVEGGGISGLVVDPDGNPLNDIFILIEATGGFRGDTRTGENGVFTALGVSGHFRISTTDIDYQPLVREVTVPCGELVEVELVLTPVDE
jgi:hypothetical protein